MPLILLFIKKNPFGRACIQHKQLNKYDHLWVLFSRSLGSESWDKARLMSRNVYATKANIILAFCCDCLLSIAHSGCVVGLLCRFMPGYDIRTQTRRIAR